MSKLSDATSRFLARGLSEWHHFSNGRIERLEAHSARLSDLNGQLQAPANYYVGWDVLRMVGERWRGWQHRKGLRREVFAIEPKARALQIELQQAAEANASSLLGQLAEGLSDTDRAEYDKLVRLRDDAHTIWAEHDRLLTLSRTALREIDEALEAIDDAQLMEVVDGFTDNAALDLLSYMETDGASDEIKEAVQAVKAFSEACDEAKTRLKGLDVDDGDLSLFNGIDLAVDVFAPDIVGALMSAVNYFKLQKAEDQLEPVKDQVDRIEDKLEEAEAQSGTQYDRHQAALVDRQKALLSTAATTAETTAALQSLTRHAPQLSPSQR